LRGDDHARDHFAGITRLERHLARLERDPLGWDLLSILADQARAQERDLRGLVVLVHKRDADLCGPSGRDRCLRREYWRGLDDQACGVGRRLLSKNARSWPCRIGETRRRAGERNELLDQCVDLLLELADPGALR
jgi:hypothetical protein